MLKNKVKQITCGIMFNRSFKLLDRWGDIADSILYKNKYFSAEYFPNISNYYTVERSLTNHSLGHSIQLTANNLIYTHVIQTYFENELDQFEDRIKKFLIPKVIEENSLITQRIGIVYICEITNKGIADFTSKYFKSELEGVSDFRFSKKESTLPGITISKNSDYINKIYTVGNIDENTRGIIFDYQIHYTPPQTYISDKFTSIIEKSKTLLQNEILNLGDQYDEK